MFTGIIETCGEVASLELVETGAVLRVRAPFLDELALGESVAVNGACLTVTSTEGGAMRFDLLHETLRLTNLGSLAPGDAVNLERSLRVGDRLSGHFVQGHVDACAEVLAYDPVGQDRRLEIALPPEFARLAAPKGSICVDGISLTLAALGDDRFTLWIIPHTHEVTNLRHRRPGDRVNLEFDLLAKHLARLVGQG